MVTEKQLTKAVLGDLKKLVASTKEKFQEVGKEFLRCAYRYHRDNTVIPQG